MTQFPCTTDGVKVYGSPIGDAIITLPFGGIDATHPNGHLGIDLGDSPPPLGRQIWLLAPGIVTEHGTNDPVRGNFIVVDHGDIKSHYFHMQYPVPWSSGVSLPHGTKLGEVGMTGNTTGPHLHWGVQNNAGIFVNPVDYFGGSAAVPDVYSPSQSKNLDLTVIMQNVETVAVGFEPPSQAWPKGRDVYELRVARQ